MTHQGLRWDEEYTKDRGVLSSRRTQPSQVLVSYIDKYRPDSGSALDIGSGLGRNSKYLAELGNNVTGFEVSRKAIEQATKHENVDYVYQDLGEKWAIGDGEVDLAIDMMTLHLLSQDAQANYASELSRVLRPNGIFVINTFSADGYGNRGGSNTEPDTFTIPESGMVERPLSAEALTALFAQLQEVEIEEYDIDYKFYKRTLTTTHIAAIFRKQIMAE